MRYGTSGFRTHHSIIESNATKIGACMTILAKREARTFGIMITASHNHHEDNGVKIMDDNGDMVSLEIEQYLENYVNQDVHKTECTFIDQMCYENMGLIIGYDSRVSSPYICELIIQGIKSINPDFPFKIYEYVTTPQLHYLFSQISQELTYLDYVKRASNLVNIECILDCANGIGAKFMMDLRHSCIKLVNVEWEDHIKLNTSCSSDYVCTTRSLPKLEGLENTIVQDNLCASFDGDADRIVFYYRRYDGIHIFNGDYIVALVFTYLSKQLVNCVNDVTIGFIYTGYTNNACVDYIKSLKFPNNVEISYICTATGVKHLHNKALKYDVGVYFEQNGHGNVIFNRNIDELSIISQLFHPVIGDGVMDLFATLYILQTLEWNVQEWSEIYTDYPSKLGKCSVLDKDSFCSSVNELKLIKPKYLQTYINELCINQLNSCRAFVRASGTENVVRVYVESVDKSITHIVYTKINDFIEYNYNVTQHVIKDDTFIVRPITYDDATISYWKLLGQLSVIDPDQMDTERSRIFIQNLGINHQIHIIVHCKSGQIIASGTLLIEEKFIHNYGKVGHIEDIVVHQDFRGYGLGKLMIEHLTYMGEKQSCYKCILDCNDANVCFYKKCGYIRKGAEMGKYL
jgi:phosphoacetylglucosamine mutase